MAGTFSGLTAITRCENTTSFTDNVASIGTASPAAEGTNYVYTYDTGTDEPGLEWLRYDNGSNINFSTNGPFFYIWFYPIKTSRLEDKDDATNPGVSIHIEDASNNYKRWNVTGADCLQEDLFRTGFKRYLVDPNATADASSGTLSLTTIRYFEVRINYSNNQAGTKSANDFLAYGEGLTYTGGGTALSPLDLDDALDYSETNGEGVIESADSGVYSCLGRLIFDSSASDLHFNQLGGTFIFPERRGALDTEVGIYSSSNPPGLTIKESAANDTNVVFGDEDTETNGTTFVTDTTGPQLTCTTPVAKLKFLGCTLNGWVWSLSGGNPVIKNSNLIGCDEYPLGTNTFEGNIVSGATSGVLMGASHVSKNNQYIGNTDAVHVSDNGPLTVTLDGDTFSGNTDDIHFSGTGTLTVKNTNGADATSDRTSGGGTVVIENIVLIRVTALDESGSPISGARVLLKKTVGGATVLSGTTNASGILEDDDYDYPLASFAVEGWIRDHTSSPYRKEYTLAGDVDENGYNVTAVMLSDE